MWQRVADTSYFIFHRKTKRDLGEVCLWNSVYFCSSGPDFFPLLSRHDAPDEVRGVVLFCVEFGRCLEKQREIAQYCAR